MADYQVIVSERADKMLVQHARFLARVSKTAALRMVEEYEGVLGALETNPFQYPVDAEYDLPEGYYRKALFSRWYKALFAVEGNEVYLDAVLDCRQDNREMFRG